MYMYMYLYSPSYI